MTIELSSAMIEKAHEAITRSKNWGFIDRILTLELTVVSTRYDRERDSSSP